MHVNDVWASSFLFLLLSSESCRWNHVWHSEEKTQVWASFGTHLPLLPSINDNSATDGLFENSTSKWFNNGNLLSPSKPNWNTNFIEYQGERGRDERDKWMRMKRRQKKHAIATPNGMWLASELVIREKLFGGRVKILFYVFFLLHFSFNRVRCSSKVLLLMVDGAGTAASHHRCRWMYQFFVCAMLDVRICICIAKGNMEMPKTTKMDINRNIDRKLLWSENATSW